MKTLKYGIKHIEGGDRAKDLPLAMAQSAQSIVNALDSFNYNGKDPNLVLARVAALEALTEKLTRLPRAMHVDYVSITPTTANSPASETVTFPPGYFLNPPSVFVNPNSAVPGSQITGASASNVTKDSARINLTRTNTTTTGVMLVAIEW